MMSANVERVEGSDIYLVDLMMFDTPGYLGCYIVEGDKSAIIDTGLSTSVEHIFDALDELGIRKNEVDYIAPTHIHLDHAGGAGFLAEECENAKVVVHERGVEYLSNSEKLDTLIESVRDAVGPLADEYGTAKPIPRERFKVVEGGEKICLGDRELEVIEASGHAPHQVCFYDTKERALFTGDEAGMFIDGELKPTTPPPNFDFEKNLDSLETLKEFDADVLLYPHFGPRFDKTGLDEYDDVLREWVNDVREASEKHGRDTEKIVGELSGDWNLLDLPTDVRGVLEYLDDK